MMFANHRQQYPGSTQQGSHRIYTHAPGCWTALPGMHAGICLGLVLHELMLLVLQIFTTVHDGQTELCVLIYSGESNKASKNRLLGQFQLINLPPAPYGVPQIEASSTSHALLAHLLHAKLDGNPVGLLCRDASDMTLSCCYSTV